MENKIITQIHASLEKSSDVVDTLNWKLTTLKSEDRDIETGITDYIGFSIDNLKQSIDSKKFYIKELQALIKQDTAQIEAIKIDGVDFFDEMGVSKLHGHIVSSISITKAKHAQEKTKEVFKHLVPKDEIEELLITLGKAERVTETSMSESIPAKLRVTARRVKNVEIEGD